MQNITKLAANFLTMEKRADVNAARIMENLLAVGLRDKNTEGYLAENKRNLFETMNSLCLLLLDARLQGNDEQTGVLENAVNAIEETISSL